MSYLIALGGLLVFYILAIGVIGRIKRVRLVNGLMSLAVYCLYLYVVYSAYKSVGIHDWNFQNTLPVANVSPFMFSLMPLTWVLPKGAKKYLYTLISLLSLGMLISTFISCGFNALRDYKFHIQFLADYLAHILLSLWGVYLVKSGQVSLCKRDCLIGGSIILGVALVMLGLNVVFDTAFFGLSLNGKHNIYNIVLVESSALSAVIYLVGLVTVMLEGYFYNRILVKKEAVSND